MQKNKHVVILGAGPTGMASGVKLAEAGFKVTVIERLPWTGGLCKTYVHGDYHLDLGPHRFTPHNQLVYDFVNKLCEGRLHVVKYKAEILIAERFLKYPFQMGDLIKNLSPRLSAAILWNYGKAALGIGRRADDTYEHWIGNRFGAGIRDLIFRPLVEKVWGTPLSELAPRFARQRIATASLLEIAIEVLTGRRNTRHRSQFYPDNSFLYPMGGFGTIVDSMEATICKHGGTIITNAPVTEVKREGNAIRSVSYQKDGQTKTVEGDFFITTVPIQYFFEMVRPAPTGMVKTAAGALKTRKLIIIYLVLKMERFSENTSFYFPSRDFPYGRAWEQKNHGEDTIKRKDRTVLGLEIPVWKEDALWGADDKTIFEAAFAPLEKRGILARKDVEEYFTVKLGWVYPVWDLPFEKNLETLLGYEREIENLIFNGRPGLYFYNNIHQSVEMGILAADHVISGLPKAQKWNKDSEMFARYQLVE